MKRLRSNERTEVHARAGVHKMPGHRVVNNSYNKNVPARLCTQKGYAVLHDMGKQFCLAVAALELID